MMTSGSAELHTLTGNIHNFERWKKDLARSLKSFRLWLRRNNLFSERVDGRLHELLSILKQDYVTIAFAGEFSRGKTELINAMFFARYGKRILPSQAGRTTMCPTELFYDLEQQETYIKLLAIETRDDPRPLVEFRQLDDYWIKIPINTDSAEQMAESLRRVTETKMVDIEVAESLGFSPEHLEQVHNQVEIPMWRHALVSFDHPMLMKGLCILDTPGLNALGSEPELTLSLLPSAQAVIFLLAADAGVTASDMAIWNEHISQLKNRPNLGLYAVLNKVDVLWDDLSTEDEIQANVNNIINITSKQLDIPESHVIPISAQKALLGRVKEDKALFEKSRLGILEDVLSSTIMGSKEQNLWQNVITDARDVVSDSLALIQNRETKLKQQLEDMTSIRDSSHDRIEQVVELAKQQQQKYRTQSLNLKPSLRLMDRQALMLKDTLAPAKIQRQIDLAANQMKDARSTVGMLKGMRQFFFQIDALMIDFCHEAERCNRLAESVFQRYQENEDNETFTPRLLTAKQYRRDLNSIFSDSDQFNRHLKLALSGKSQVVSRFFNTTVYNISRFMETTREKVDHWADHVLHPLNQQLRDEKARLDSYQQELQDIRQSGSDAGGRIKALETLLDDIAVEVQHGQATFDLLQRFEPDNERSNIVRFKERKYSF